MPIYEFEREDGEIVEKLFPISNIPDEIICSDGVKATRKLYPSSFGVVWKGALPYGQVLKRKEQMTKKNIEAGKRGEKEWRERLKRKHTKMSDKELK